MRKTIYFLLMTLLVTSCVSKQRRERMEQLLSKAEGMNKNYTPMDTVKFMDEVVRFFSLHGNREEKMRSNYMMGCVYRDRRDAPMALQYYNDAVSEVDTTKEACDYLQMAKIYGQMALLFEQQRYIQKELSMWQKTAIYAKLAKDTLFYTQCLDYMSDTYWRMKEQDSALTYSRQAYINYLQIGKVDYAASSLVTQIDIYLQRNDLVQAEQSIEEYKCHSGLVLPNSEMSRGYELFYYYLGAYYEKCSNLDSALYFYRKLITYPTLMNLENGYKGLMAVYQRLHLSDSIVKYALLYANANDSVNFLHSANEVNRVQGLYDYSEHQRIASLKTKEVNALWRIIYIGTTIIVLVVCGVYLCLRRQRIQITKSKEQYHEILVHYDNAVQELDSLRKGNKDFEVAKETEIKLLQEQIAAYQNNAQEETSKLVELLNQRNIVQTMHQHAKALSTPSNGDWVHLIESVKEMLPDFYARVYLYKSNTMTQEFRICILTKLNFLPSEITVLLGTSSQRIANLRRTINKKMFGEDSAKSLDMNLLQL